jgi:hypothetical protein
VVKGAGPPGETEPEFTSYLKVTVAACKGDVANAATSVVDDRCDFFMMLIP